MIAISPPDTAIRDLLTPSTFFSNFYKFFDKFWFKKKVDLLDLFCIQTFFSYLLFEEQTD